MSYARYLANHELFWAMLSGALLGAAVAFATMPVRRARRPRRARSRHRAAAIMATSGAVVAAAAGFIFPDNLALLTVRSAIVAGTALVAAGVAFRFPRAAGLPVLILVGGTVVFFSSALDGWHPVRSQAVVAEIVVVSMSDASLTLEVADVLRPDLPSGIVEQDGDALRVTAEELVLSPYLFLLGASRFIALSEPGIRQLPNLPPFPESFYDHASVTATTGSLNVLQRYQVVVAADSRSLGIVRVR